MGAPDGGWGWVVVVGVGITFAVTTGPVSCFGLIFDKWLRDVGAETSDFTFLSGLYFALSFMPGVLARRLLRLFSCRQVCAAGAIMCAIGCGAAALCDSVAFLVVAYSVLQGVGMGLLLPAAFTSLNSYFRRRRTLAVAAAQLLAAAGAALYPALVHALMRRYGFRGTQAVLGALSLHAVAGAATMRPAPRRRRSLRGGSGAGAGGGGGGGGGGAWRGATLVARAGAPLEARRARDSRSSSRGSRSSRDSSRDEDDAPLVPHAHQQHQQQQQQPPKLPPPPASFPPDDVPPPILEEESEAERSPRQSPLQGVKDPRCAPSDSPELSEPRPLPPSSPSAFRKDFARPHAPLGKVSMADGERRHRHRRRRRRGSQRHAVSFADLPATYIEASPEHSPVAGEETQAAPPAANHPAPVPAPAPAPAPAPEPPPPPPPLSTRARLAQRRPTGPNLFSASIRRTMARARLGLDSDDSDSGGVGGGLPLPRGAGSLPTMRRLSRRVSVMLLTREDPSSSSASASDPDDEMPRPPPPCLRHRKQSVAAVAAGAAAAAVAEDWAVLRTRGFAVAALGASMALFSDGMWVALVPLHAAALGLGPGAGARLVAAGSAGDVLGRAALVAGARWAQGRARLVFLASCLLALPLRCGYAVTGEAGALTALATALGVLRACRQVALPLLFAERFPAARFPAAFGLFLMAAGLAHLLLGPFVGLVRDVTGSYPACLGALAALLVLCVVPWSVELALYPPPGERPTLPSLS